MNIWTDVLSTIRAAKGKEKVIEELQLHSDQGFNWDFFSILKTDCIYRAEIRTYEAARRLIGAYIRSTMNISHLKQNWHHSKSDVRSLLKV